MKEVTLFSVMTKGEDLETNVKRFESLESALEFAADVILESGTSCLLANETYMVEK